MKEVIVMFRLFFHWAKREYKCYICGATFGSVLELSEHYVKEHTGRR